MKEDRIILPMETLKWRRGVAGPQGQHRNTTVSERRAFETPKLEWERVKTKNERPSGVERALPPLRRVAGKMVIIRETGVRFRRRHQQKIQEGWTAGGWGLEENKEKGAPGLPQPRPGQRPPRSPGAAERSGPQADKRQVLPPNWVAGEDPGATKQEAE